MSETSQPPSDRELLAAVEKGKEGVQRGRSMFRARHAMERYRDPGSKVSSGRDKFTKEACR